MKPKGSFGRRKPVAAMIGAGLIVGTLIWYVQLGGGGFVPIVHMPMLLLSLLLPLALGVMSYGVGGMVAVVWSLRVLGKSLRPAEITPVATQRLGGMIIHTYISAAVATTIIIIAMLQQFGDVITDPVGDVLAEAIARWIQCVLYAVVVAELIFRPALNATLLTIEQTRGADGPGGRA